MAKTTLAQNLERLKDISSAELLDVICCRVTFDEGPDASAFLRACVERLDEIREILKVCGEDEWTVDALRRALDR